MAIAVSLQSLSGPFLPSYRPSLHIRSPGPPAAAAESLHPTLRSLSSRCLRRLADTAITGMLASFDGILFIEARRSPGDPQPGSGDVFETATIVVFFLILPPHRLRHLAAAHRSDASQGEGQIEDACRWEIGSRARRHNPHLGCPACANDRR